MIRDEEHAQKGFMLACGFYVVDGSPCSVCSRDLQSRAEAPATWSLLLASASGTEDGTVEACQPRREKRTRSNHNELPQHSPDDNCLPVVLLESTLELEALAAKQHV
ncbi:unnamed protein product [Rangifer tarandus platyrhynchus]|uniref:Uncharacterized protein n=2 Tax=Rangifer tarandus platyrhynchus TaxID=3082113 RepID=A0ABN8ZPI3_RANTA|nr:unnamed protein product [Rangifer tarandus platyrhynchus]CAI9706728.1 unnamed protein product [Rangifer tarandus platyrhynchus]